MTNGRIKDNKILQPLNKQTWTNNRTQKTIITNILGYKSDGTPVMDERITTTVIRDFWTGTVDDLDLFTTHTPATTVEQNMQTIQGRQVAHGVKLNKYPFPGVNQGMITLTHQSFIDYNYAPTFLHIIVSQDVYFRVSFFNNSFIEIENEEESTTYTELCYDMLNHKLYVNGVEADTSTSRNSDDITFYVGTAGLVIYDMYIDTKKTVNPNTFSLTEINEGTVIVNPNNSIYPDGTEKAPIIMLQAEQGSNTGEMILTPCLDDGMIMLNIYDGYIYYKNQKADGYETKAIRQDLYDNIHIVSLKNLDLVTIQYTSLLLKFPEEILTKTIPIENLVQREQMLNYPPNNGIPVASSRNGYYAYQYDTPLDTSINQEITIYADSYNPTMIMWGLGTLGQSVTDPYEIDDWIQGIYDSSDNYDDFTRYNQQVESHKYTMEIIDGEIMMYRDGVYVDDLEPYTPSVGEDMYLIIITQPNIANISVVQKYTTSVVPLERYQPSDHPHYTYSSYESIDITQDQTISIVFSSPTDAEYYDFLIGIGTFTPEYETVNYTLWDVDVTGVLVVVDSELDSEYFDGERHVLALQLREGNLTAYLDGELFEDEGQYMYEGTMSDTTPQHVLIVRDETLTNIYSIKTRMD